MAENLWTIVNILVDRPHAQLRKLLRKCVKLSYKTEDTLHYVCNCIGLSQGNVNAFYRMNGDSLLHHDNAPAHTSLVVREFLTNKNMTTVP
jgi:hypothetical protein